MEFGLGIQVRATRILVSQRGRFDTCFGTNHAQGLNPECPLDHPPRRPRLTHSGRPVTRHRRPQNARPRSCRDHRTHPIRTRCTATRSPLANGTRSEPMMTLEGKGSAQEMRPEEEEGCGPSDRSMTERTRVAVWNQIGSPAPPWVVGTGNEPLMNRRVPELDMNLSEPHATPARTSCAVRRIPRTNHEPIRPKGQRPRS